MPPLLNRRLCLLQEEGGFVADDTHNPFLGEEGDPLLKKREEQLQVGVSYGVRIRYCKK